MPVPPEALRSSPELAATDAIEKYSNVLRDHPQPSAWDLSLDRSSDLARGGLVLADVSFAIAIPKRSMWIVVQLLEARLAQVVFHPRLLGAPQCAIVPIERLCVPIEHEIDYDYNSGSS